MEYIIISKNSKAFWHNLNGWVGWWDATVYTQDEREMFDLPCDGDWIPFHTQTVRTVQDLQQVLSQYPSYLQFRMLIDTYAVHDSSSAKTPFRVSVAAVNANGQKFVPLEAQDADNHVVVIEVG